MREREKFEVHEMRQAVFERDHYECQNCGESIWRFGSPQCAHIIHQSKANVKKYGANIIHSIHNMAAVCGLKCNDAMNVGIANEEREAKRIRRMIDEKNI